MISIDGARNFCLHQGGGAEPAGRGRRDQGRARRLRRRTIPADIVAHEPWTAGAALVAERFQDRRVLLAGDAVHLFTPTGGFGMNTGLEDASNLAWKLAALVQGWGGPRLLATYEAERLPIALRNTGAARQLSININDVTRQPETEAGHAGRR